MLKNIIKRLLPGQDKHEQKLSAIKKPVFIIGCARSGTTLLFQLLRRHPELMATEGYPDGEDHEGWVKYGNCLISGLGYVDINNGMTGGHHCLYMDEHDVDEAIRNNMHQYYAEQVLKRDHTKRVINKCPHLSNKLAYVRAIFPDARFIHIVRDCLPVVSSWINMIQEKTSLAFYWPDSDHPCFWISPKADQKTGFPHEPRLFPGGKLEYIVDYWRETNRNIPTQLANTPGQLMTIRYEDLCNDTPATLASILEFCGLSTHDLSTLDDYDREPAIRNNDNFSNIDESVISVLLDRASDVREQFGYSGNE